MTHKLENKIMFSMNRIINFVRHKIRISLSFLGVQTIPLVITSVKEKSLTYLSSAALHDLYEQVIRIERENISGCLIEAGCALGGSAIVIGTAKSISRPLYVYDVFGIIPPPSEMDGPDVKNRYQEIQSGSSQGIDGDLYYGYVNDLINKVEENFNAYQLPLIKNNIYLIQGLFQDVLHLDREVALAHIDGDWYDSVKVCLEQIEPHLVSGGTLIIDDYDSWSGCRKAVREYFKDKESQYRFSHKSRLHITKL